MDADDETQALQGRSSGLRLAIVGIALLAFLAILEMTNIYEKRTVFRKNRLVRNNPLLLFFITLLALVTHIMAYVLWSTDWLLPQTILDCNVLIQAGIMLMYVVIKQFIYVFLFERVKVVHDALRLRDWKLVAFRKALFLFATIGIPLAMYPLVFVYFRGTVVPILNGTSGLCVQHAIARGPVIFLAMSDLSMSLFLLALFVLPLLGHIREGMTDAGRLYALARRNVIVSAMMVIMTLLTMIFFAMFDVRPDGVSADRFLVNTTLVELSDVLVCTILTHFLSSGWVPSCIQNRLTLASTHENNSRSDNLHAPKSKPSTNPQNQVKIMSGAELVVSTVSSITDSTPGSIGQVVPKHELVALSDGAS